MGPLFGDLFDLNGDGYATPEEEILGMMMMEDIIAEEEKKKRAPWDDIEDGDEDEDGEDYW